MKSLWKSGYYTRVQFKQMPVSYTGTKDEPVYSKLFIESSNDFASFLPKILTTSFLKKDLKLVSTIYKAFEKSDDPLKSIPQFSTSITASSKSNCNLPSLLNGCKWRDILKLVTLIVPCPLSLIHSGFDESSKSSVKFKLTL